MQYNGGKGGYTKGICRVIRQFLRPGGSYWEPFVGAGNLMQGVRCRRRYGSDVNAAIINLLNAVQGGWLPPKSLTEEEYRHWNEVRRRDQTDPMVAFVGYGCSFGGKFFAGMARRKGAFRCYAANARSGLLRQKPLLEGVKLWAQDYREVEWEGELPSVVYCDPPYEGTTGVGGRDPFDSAEFWEWAQALSGSSVVLVSEYACPVRGAECLWQSTRGRGLAKAGPAGKGTKTEKLFCLNPGMRRKIGFGF